MALHIASLPGPHAQEPGNEARPNADTSSCEETNTQLMVVAAVVEFLLPALSYSSVLQCPVFISMLLATVLMLPPTRLHIAWLTAPRVATDPLTCTKSK